MKKDPIALIGCDADKKISERLKKLGFHVISLPRDERLPSPIASHADTLFFSHEKSVFCSDGYASIASNVVDTLKGYGYKIIKSDACVLNKYPHDISFNCFIANNTLFGNLPHVADEIKEYAKSRQLSSVHLKQGYAKCSSIILGDRGLISADNGIISKADENKIKTLKIENSPDAISLSGYEYGFIGGACGVFKNTVYFTGNLSLHPFGSTIIDFCQDIGYSVISLSDDKLCDFGGIMFFDDLA